MIILLAPSKTMNFSQPVNQPKTNPIFGKEAGAIAAAVNNLIEDQFQKIAGTSDKLTAETLEKFKQWGSGPKQRAMQAYIGDVYNGLNYKAWNIEDINFAQKHLRVLSGLYGYVRPCDLIEQYRLEMKTSLEVSGSSNLYNFWGNKIAKELLKDNPKFIVNTTSEEYLKSIRKYLPKDLNIITPKFVEEKNGKLKDVTIFTKVMRGVYASWLVKSKITSEEELTNFNFGYTFDKKLSSKTELIFVKRK